MMPFKSADTIIFNNEDIYTAVTLLWCPYIIKWGVDWFYIIF